MIEYRAAWVVPVAAPPIRGGAVLVDRDRIVAVGPAESPSVRDPGDGSTVRLDLGRVAVMPGLVNAHTHLELSWLRGRIPAVDSFPEWIRHVIRAQRERPAPSALERRSSSVEAVKEARRCGTVLVGDIGNTLAAFDVLAEIEMPGLLFNELIGFNRPDPKKVVADARAALNRLPQRPGLGVSLAAHAPYSVSPELFRAIRGDLDRSPSSLTSVHLAESVEEIEFLQSGRGAWRSLLEEVGAWNGGWQAPGCDPVEYLARLGFLTESVLAVHGVQLGPDALGRLAASGATLVTCPRGNMKTAAGVPPIGDFFRSGVRVAVGTDSLASVDDLNLFSELAMLRRLAPEVAAPALLAAGTRHGAQALGFGEEFGTIEPGKSATFIAVDLPAGVEDVEEYLVSGIEPEQVDWVSPSE